MAVKLNDEHIGKMLDIMNSHRPYSHSVCNSLRNLQKLKGSVWVDRWPEFKVVVVRNEHSGEDETQLLRMYYLFAIDDSGLESVLKDPKVLVPGALSTCIWGLSRQLLYRLKSCIQCHTALKNFKVTEKEFFELCATNVDYDGILPKDFSERKLSTKDCDLISSHWAFLPGNERSNYIKDCLKVSRVSVCVMDDTGKPVAWSLQHILGAIGFTFVKLEYRRMGLGKYITARMARAIIRLDGYCNVLIEENNIISMAIHESIGFNRMDPLYSVPGNCMNFT